MVRCGEKLCVQLQCRTEAKEFYISVLYDSSECFLKEGSQAGVMGGQGFSNEAPFDWGCCSRQAFCQ